MFGRGIVAFTMLAVALVRPVRALAGTVLGSYNSTNLNFFALNFTWTL